MTIHADGFAFVQDLVRNESAIVLGEGKEYLVESRLQPLARSAGHADVSSYVTHVSQRRNPRDLAAVVEALTTNETSWFRDGDPFQTLRTTVFPTLAASRPDRTLRIWSAACSSGQEAYSIAMTVLDTPALAGFRVQIVGTDLSEEMVRRARAGEYSQLEVNRGLPAPLLVRHFTREGLTWRISDRLRGMVEFRPMNLTRSFLGLGRFDIVFMRNVLIYFDHDTKRDILQRVRQVTAPDGYLLLGSAEMTYGVDEAWEREPTGRSAVHRIRKGTP